MGIPSSFATLSRVEFLFGRCSLESTIFSTRGFIEIEKRAVLAASLEPSNDVHNCGG
jgi:hypothetical protein